MTIVNITKEPLYGKVYWDGLKFVYTPNDPTANNNDYFLYTKTINGVTTSYIEKINIGNLPPIANTIAITANAASTVTFDINQLAADSSRPYGILKLKNVSGATKGSTTNDDYNIYYTTNFIDYIETFNYTVTDGQYDSTSTITVSVINGYVIKPEDLSFNDKVIYYSRVINDLFSKIYTFNSLFNVLSTYETYFDSIDYEKYNSFSDIVSSSYIRWNSFYNKILNYADYYNVLQSNSSIWNNTKNNVDTINNIFLNDNSALNNLTSILNYERYAWSNAIANTNKLISIQSNDDFSTKITNIYNVITANSAAWDGVELYSIYNNLLVNFVTSYNLLTANTNASELSSWINLSTNTNFLTSKSFEYNILLNTINNSLCSINANLLNDILLVYSPLYNNFSYYIENDTSLNNLTNSINSVSASFYPLYQNLSSFYTYILDNTSKWIGTITNILSVLSANYQASYTTTNSICSNWTNVLTSKINNSYNITNFNSGYWKTLNETETLSSGIWNNTYRHLTSYAPNQFPKSTFLNKGSSYNGVYNDLSILGNLTSQNISCIGVNTTISTLIYTTSSYDILNISADTEPAIYVNKIIPNSKALLNLYVDINPIFYVNSNNTVNINLSSGSKALNVVGNISASGYFYNIFNDQVSRYQSLSTTYGTTYTSAQYISTNFAALCGLSSNYTATSNFVILSSNLINVTLSRVPDYYSAYNNVTSLSARNKIVNDFVTLCGPAFGVDNAYRSTSAFFENFFSVTSSIDNYP
jgi:hypothetical protein